MGMQEAMHANAEISSRLLHELALWFWPDLKALSIDDPAAFRQAIVARWQHSDILPTCLAPGMKGPPGDLQSWAIFSHWAGVTPQLPMTEEWTKLVLLPAAVAKWQQTKSPRDTSPRTLLDDARSRSSA